MPNARLSAAMLLLFCGGCAAWSDAQMRLADQIRKAADLCRQAHQQRQRIVDEYYELQNRRLDEAFDADMRARQPLTADWVIEHRRAYAAAVAAVQRARAAAAAADLAATGNLDAIDAAARRLMYLQSLQLRLPLIDGWLSDLAGLNAPPNPVSQNAVSDR